MLQEISEGSRSTPKRDLLLAAALILLIVFARGLARLVRLLPYGGVLQLLLFFAAIFGCWLFYRKRLCAFRYTLVFTKEEPLTDAYGDPVQPPYPPGTIVFERLNGDKVIMAEVVMPGELVAYDAPEHEKRFAPAGEKVKTRVFTAKSRRRAHVVWFRRDGRMHRILFSPSPDFSAKLLEII